MNYLFVFWMVFFALVAVVYLFDKKYFMLRDNSTATPRPYSWARVQLTWWIVIILTSFITVMVRTHGYIPTLDDTTLYLLGITSATTIVATAIDINDQSDRHLATLGQNIGGENFFLDILSDKNGIDVHRFQTVVFNIVFGTWFISQVLYHLGRIPNCAICTSQPDTNACAACMTAYADSIIPHITPNNLILLGLSSGIYAALKATENRQPTITDAQPLKVADESYTKNNFPAKG